MTEPTPKPLTFIGNADEHLDGLTVADLVHRPGAYKVMLTPDDAVWLLHRNDMNRTKKKGRIGDWARQMRDGKWRLINQGIGVDDHGNLTDGQNRMEAVIAAGIAAPFLLVTGLEPESRDVVDTGVKRSFGDVLHMNGYRNVSNLAGAVSIRARYESGAQKGWGWSEVRSRGTRLNHEELLDYMQTHPSLVDLAQRSWQIRKALGHVGLGPINAFESMAYEADPASLAYFRDALITGGMLRSGDPRLLLRNQLMRRERAADSVWTLGMFVKAWNLWIADEEREILVLKDAEPLQMLVGTEARAEQLLEHEQELAAAGR